MKVRYCGRCGEPIKRGEDYMEAVGIRFHWKCLKAVADARKEERLAKEQEPQQGEP
jgi:hypothetical protein